MKTNRRTDRRTQPNFFLYRVRLTSCERVDNKKEVTESEHGNERVPKIVINGKINLFFKTAISISLISNHNSFRVLFDEIASVYFI